MKVIKFEDSYTTSLSEIEQFEKEFSIKFPNDYKNFILQNGSGYILSEYKIINIELGEFYIREILTLTELGKSFGYFLNDIAHKEGIIGIGVTHAPISICMGFVANDYYGKVYLFGWDEGLILQANSFQEFINSFM